MSHVLAITFEDIEQGPAVLRTIKSLREQGQLSIDDAAVVVKDGEGKVKVDNMVESGVKSGALVGGFVGLLLTSVFFPLAGLAIGAGLGALFGNLMNMGVDKKFVKDVTESLKPGTSALFVIGSHARPDAVAAALSPFQGTIYQTTLDSEKVEQLQDALKRRE